MSRRIVLVAGLGFVVALIALMPLRVVLGLMPPVLAARAATGSLWSGRLVDARIGPLMLGDVQAGLDPLALLTGRVRLGLAGYVPAFAARIEAGPGGSRSIRRPGGSCWRARPACRRWRRSNWMRSVSAFRAAAASARAGG
ncbi:type II secretion system protein GspN [Sphingomonas changnyeongensis]|uniref:Type II secretion system protein N n=1 Tax=Sphingomonas changnyeongensis TaxID=2698679 RepID=A0A7Z2S597_9SPHN|nr:type II secretion system protein N [Sphingomonas changnyeongensis]QHL90855.1 type II secretion system protein GspN [Sphingomonas changnyeongensis]